MKVKATRSTGNVFLDVGFAPAEAENLKVRADLLIDLQEALSKRRMKQSEAANLLGVTQPRVSDVMRGRIELFSIDTLVNMLARLGIKVKILVKPSRRHGKVA
jgi:predicted XRE-type DNA-binding protein